MSNTPVVIILEHTLSEFGIWNSDSLFSVNSRSGREASVPGIPPETRV